MHLLCIRKNLLLCKIFRVKTSSKFLFDSYMAKFQPELETCPIWASTGNCHIHNYYGRFIIDFQSGKRKKSDLCVMRVFCDSCEHAHYNGSVAMLRIIRIHDFTIYRYDFSIGCCMCIATLPIGGEKQVIILFLELCF